MTSYEPFMYSSEFSRIPSPKPGDDGLKIGLAIRGAVVVMFLVVGLAAHFLGLSIALSLTAQRRNLNQYTLISGKYENIMKFLKAILDVIAQYRSFNATYKELSGLTDRDLKDIGISRGDIARIALGASEAAVSGKTGTITQIASAASAAKGQPASRSFTDLAA